jgi:undecaprenyl-diphosphatase
VKLLNQFDAVDRRISHELRLDTRHAPRWLITTTVRVSQAGSYGIGWIVLFAVVLTAAESAYVAVACSVLVIATLLFNTVLKAWTRRPRPQPVSDLHAPRSSSMPSAHASMAAVAAVSMSIVLPALAPLWWTIAIVVALTRVALGAHYVGDVLVGLVVGVGLGLYWAELAIDAARAIG